MLLALGASHPIFKEPAATDATSERAESSETAVAHGEQIDDIELMTSSHRQKIGIGE